MVDESNQKAGYVWAESDILMCHSKSARLEDDSTMTIYIAWFERYKLIIHVKEILDPRVVCTETDSGSGVAQVNVVVWMKRKLSHLSRRAEDRKRLRSSTKNGAYKYQKEKG